MIRLCAAALLALAPLAAAAQGASPDGGAGGRADGGTGIAFTLGAGVATVPEYFGSNQNQVSPELSFDLGYVGLGPLRFGDRDFDAVREGLGLRGSFRYVPERDGDEFEDDDGIGAVDATVELGGGVRYARPWYEAFAVARYGFGGSEAAVGDLGLDLIARPTERLALRAGPRLLYGSDDYAETYFSTEDAFDVRDFEASGGLLTSGVEVGASYRLTDAWGLEATARFERLQNDAARSPVSNEDDQVSASVAVTRRFDFNF